MSAPVSAMITSATVCEIPGMVTSACRAAAKGEIMVSMRALRGVDGGLLGVELGQVLRHHERVVLGEPAHQCLDQRWDLAAQGAPGQAGKHLRVAFPGDQHLQHGPR
jgi:hypothetical protein